MWWWGIEDCVTVDAGDMLDIYFYLVAQCSFTDTCLRAYRQNFMAFSPFSFPECKA